MKFDFFWCKEIYSCFDKISKISLNVVFFPSYVIIILWRVNTFYLNQQILYISLWNDKFSAIFKELQYVCFLNYNFVGNIISENNRRHFSNQRFEISSLNVYSFSLAGFLVRCSATKPQLRFNIMNHRGNPAHCHLFNFFIHAQQVIPYVHAHRKCKREYIFK